jgi:hypothetical protein
MIQSTLTKSVETLNGYSALFDLPKGKKSVSTMKKVICLTTDEDSLSSANRMNKDLTHMLVTELPVEVENLSFEAVKHNFDNINKILVDVNEMFGSVKTMLDIPSFADNTEVEIDDDIMINFLAVMQKNQRILSHISDYLNMVIQAQEVKNEIENGEFTKYSLEEFQKLLTSEVA